MVKKLKDKTLFLLFRAAAQNGQPDQELAEINDAVAVFFKKNWRKESVCCCGDNKSFVNRHCSIYCILKMRVPIVV